MEKGGDGLGDEIQRQLLFAGKFLNQPLSEVQLQQFNLYLHFLLDHNKRISLTAINEPKKVISRHFKDSLSCLMVTGDLSSLRLIDVGTGAGFPGVPLKVACPDMNLTLVESVTKKTEFLEELVSILNLKDVDIINERVEVIGQDPSHRSQYDWAVARAVASLPTLVEYLLPLVRIGGKILAMKGEGIQREYEESQAALNKLGGDEGVVGEVQYDFYPATEGGTGAHATSHYLVTVKKVRQTPAEYPRRVGVPSKRPLA